MDIVSVAVDDDRVRRTLRCFFAGAFFLLVPGVTSASYPSSSSTGALRFLDLLALLVAGVAAPAVTGAGESAMIAVCCVFVSLDMWFLSAVQFAWAVEQLKPMHSGRWCRGGSAWGNV